MLVTIKLTFFHSLLTRQWIEHWKSPCKWMRAVICDRVDFAIQMWLPNRNQAGSLMAVLRSCNFRPRNETGFESATIWSLHCFIRAREGCYRLDLLTDSTQPHFSRPYYFPRPSFNLDHTQKVFVLTLRLCELSVFCPRSNGAELLWTITRLHTCWTSHWGKNLVKLTREAPSWLLIDSDLISLLRFVFLILLLLWPLSYNLFFCLMLQFIS